MRLSDAIRLGSMLKPQGFRALWDDRGGSCALGAAYDAGGLAGRESNDLVVKNTFPLLAAIAPCPGDGCPVHGHPVIGLIAHLNDDHGWTREAIAEWGRGDRSAAGDGGGDPGRGGPRVMDVTWSVLIALGLLTCIGGLVELVSRVRAWRRWRRSVRGW